MFFNSVTDEVRDLDQKNLISFDWYLEYGENFYPTWLQNANSSESAGINGREKRKKDTGKTGRVQSKPVWADASWIMSTRLWPPGFLT